MFSFRHYLTLFESLSDPAFLINADALIENLNVNAARLLKLKDTPGGIYYGQPERYPGQVLMGKSKDEFWATIIGSPLADVLPWLKGVITAAGESKEMVLSRELKTEVNNQPKYYWVTLSGMLDVSGKFDGAVVVLSDITSRKLMEEKVLTLASTDPLTGVQNRRSFMDQAKTEWIRSRRYHHPCSFLMMDIDHFKKINDTYGHQLGDLALRNFAKTCLKVVRNNDLLGRLGGEEFGVLLVETNKQRALNVAERLRQKVSSAAISNGKTSFNIQVSIGVASLQDDDPTIDETMRRADQALYKAKHLGRNRIEG